MPRREFRLVIAACTGTCQTALDGLSPLMFRARDARLAFEAALFLRSSGGWSTPERVEERLIALEEHEAAGTWRDECEDFLPAVEVRMVDASHREILDAHFARALHQIAIATDINPAEKRAALAALLDAHPGGPRAP